jgi:polyhydroxyalkanoate synthesis repressor PhaR
MAEDKNTEGGGTDKPIVIKKYANRRLYNTATSSYVTLDHLARMVKDKIEFVVHDAKTGEDITRSVLTQIIVEEEAKGQHLLPISFLRQLIGLYGDNLQGLVPQYLELTMQSFARNQEQIRKYLSDAFGSMYPFDQFEKMSRQNMAIFEQAVNMFSPFGANDARNAEGPAPSGEKPAAGPGEEAGLDELKSQLSAMQKQLDELSKKDKD